MSDLDLKDLVKGILVVVGIAIAADRYSGLQSFAREQGIQALHGWKTQPFFPPGYSTLRKSNRTVAPQR